MLSAPPVAPALPPFQTSQTQFPCFLPFLPPSVPFLVPDQTLFLCNFFFPNYEFPLSSRPFVLTLHLGLQVPFMQSEWCELAPSFSLPPPSSRGFLGEWFSTLALDLFSPSSSCMLWYLCSPFLCAPQLLLRLFREKDSVFPLSSHSRNAAFLRTRPIGLFVPPVFFCAQMSLGKPQGFP